MGENICKQYSWEWLNIWNRQIIHKTIITVTIFLDTILKQFWDCETFYVHFWSPVNIIGFAFYIFAQLNIINIQVLHVLIDSWFQKTCN